MSRAKDRRDALSEQLAAQGTAPLPARDAPWPTDLQRRRGLVDMVVARVTLNPADPDWHASRGFDTGRVKIDPR
jgi:hypothetical protein